jgi:hypothetical protein
MPKFTWGDSVRILENAPGDLRPGSVAAVVGVEEDRQGSYYEKFPEGVVYTVEFEDGSSVDVHESYLAAPA